MADHPSANHSLLISRDRAGNVIGNALRLFVGRGRRYSVKQLSNATGVKDRAIECAMARPDSGDYRPLPNEALLSITSFLGASFTNEWLSLTSQGAFDLPEAEPDPGSLAADNSDDNARVVRAAVDGHFGDSEVKDLHDVGARMVSRGAQLVGLKARGAA